MTPDLLILRIESLLCIAAALCAGVYAILHRWRAVRISGATVAALSLLIVSEVIGAALLDASAPAGATSQSARPAPIPLAASTGDSAPPPQATRMTAMAPAHLVRTFSAAWADVVRVSAAALKEHDKAGEDLRTGDVSRAAGELADCAEIASRVPSYAAGLQGGLDNGSDLELLAATKRIGDGLHGGCTSARAYIETSAPSDFDDAKTRFADVVEAIVRAESLARAKYQRMGGNPDNLASFKTALR
jgi:hypothetical protein